MLCNLPTILLSESFPTIGKKTLWLAVEQEWAAAGETGSFFRVQHACFRIFGLLELVGSESDENSDVQQKFAFIWSLPWFGRLRSGDVRR
jgi:hypothetical protein